MLAPKRLLELEMALLSHTLTVLLALANSRGPVPVDPAAYKLTVPPETLIPPPKVFEALKFTVPPELLTIN